MRSAGSVVDQGPFVLFDPFAINKKRWCAFPNLRSLKLACCRCQTIAFAIISLEPTHTPDAETNALYTVRKAISVRRWLGRWSSQLALTRRKRYGWQCHSKAKCLVTSIPPATRLRADDNVWKSADLRPFLWNNVFPKSTMYWRTK